MHGNIKFKTNLLIIFTILLLYNFLLSQEWINVSPLEENSGWIDGCFVSAEEGWAFSGSMAHGDTIYYTTDGAQTWEVIYTLENPDEYIIWLQMTDNLNGWMTKRWYDYPDIDIYYYLKTTDGGYSWDDMSAYLSNIEVIGPLYFVNEELGFVEGRNNETMGSMIYKTIDGGYNWFETTVPMPENEPLIPGNYWITKFFFLDENHGWTSCLLGFGLGLSLFTLDGGETWELGVEPGYSEFWDIHFINPNIGGIAGINHIIITEDNFETFIYHYGGMAFAIHFQNEIDVWYASTSLSESRIYKSIDGGTTFDDYQIIDTNYLSKIQFFGDVGYIFGSDNSLLKYEDNLQINSEIIIDNKYSISVFPNPFKSETEIYYSFPENIQQATIEIYNIKGQIVKQITDIRNQTSVSWNGSNFDNRNVSSGIYLYQLNIDGKTKAFKKCLKLK